MLKPLLENHENLSSINIRVMLHPQHFHNKFYVVSYY